MRQFFLLFSLLAASYLAFAQSDEPFGHYYDLDGNLLLYKADHKYAPETKFDEYFVQSEHTQPAFYYDLKGEKRHIELSGTVDKDWIKYEVDNLGKTKKLRPGECTALVVQKDSFAVISNFDIIKGLGNYTVTDPTFARVVDHIPGHLFYELHSDAQLIFLYQQKDGNVVSVPKSLKKLAGFCVQNFPEYKILHRLVAENKIEKDELGQVIRVVDYMTRYQKNAKLYFDEYWNELEEPEDYEYYGKIEKVEDFHWYITYFDQSDTKLWRAVYDDLNTMSRVDTTKWFDQSGQVRLSLRFANNKVYSRQYYHSNGQLHYIIRKNFGSTDSDFRYYLVSDLKGQNLLDENGNGKENYYDPVNGRHFVKVFEQFNIKTVYYEDEEGNRRYQLTDRNVKIKSFNKISYEFKERFDYSESWGQDYVQGMALARLHIDESGYVEDVEIISSPGYRVNNEILNTIKRLFDSRDKSFRPAKANKEKVKSEVVLPIELAVIKSQPTYHNYYWMHYDPFMFHNMHPTSIPSAPMGF